MSNAWFQTKYQLIRFIPNQHVVYVGFMFTFLNDLTPSRPTSVRVPHAHLPIKILNKH